MTDRIEVGGASAEKFVASKTYTTGWETYASHFADGIAAVIPGTDTTKIFFFEQTANETESGIAQRVICCVTMPNDRFGQTVKVLNKIVEAEDEEND